MYCRNYDTCRMVFYEFWCFSIQGKKDIIRTTVHLIIYIQNSSANVELLYYLKRIGTNGRIEKDRSGRSRSA